MFLCEGFIRLLR